MDNELNIIPFDCEAELEVLGSMLCDKLAIVKALPIISGNDFYVPLHKEIFLSIVKVFNKDGIPHLGKILGNINKSYPDFKKENMIDMMKMRGGAVSIVYYSKKVKEASTKRDIIYLCEEAKQKAYDKNEKSLDITEMISERSFKLSIGVDTSDGFVTAYDIAKKRYNEIDDMRTNGTKRKSILTGISYFDKATGGLRAGQVMILAASTSAGKTAMAANIALDVSQNYGKVMYFSYEMTPEELIDRLISYKSGIYQDNLGEANLSDTDMVRFAETIDTWSNGNLILDKTKCETVALIKSRCRNQKVKTGLELIVIDYISQIPNGGGKPIERIATISREIKLMAMDLQVPVIALSQLNRADLEKPPRRPNMYNLKETSAIEQDADIVALMYRPGFWGDDEVKAAGYDINTEYNITEMTIAKNRSGKTGKFNLIFDGETSQFKPFIKG